MIVGEASVVIRAVGDKLEGDIQKLFEKAGARGGDKGGKAASDNFSDSTEKGLKSRMEGATEPIREALGTAGERGGIEAGRRAADRIKESIEDAAPDLDRAGNSMGFRIGNQMSRGFQRSNFTRTLASSAVKLGVLIPIVAVVVGGISALVSGLFALSAALGTAAASSVGLLGALTALVGGLGVVVLAAGGVGEAIKNGLDPEKAEEFAAAMEKLSPPAQDFVNKIIGMKDGFLELRDIASSNLFPGINTALDNLGALMPTIRTGVQQTSSAVGDAAVSISQALSSAAFMGSLGNIFESNSVFIRDFGVSLGALARTFVALLDAAEPVTLILGKTFREFTTNLSSLTEAGNRTGRLTQYFRESVAVMDLVWENIKNLSEGLYDLGRIAQPFGVSLLESFEKATGGLADFTDKAENVTKTTEYFAAVEQNVLAISNLVGELGEAFIRMGASPGIKATADAFAEIIPEIETALTSSIESIGPRLAQLVGSIAELFTVLEESGAIAAIIDIFNGIATALTSVANTPGLGPVITNLLKFYAVYKALSVVGRLSGAAFGGVIPLISRLGGAFGATASRGAVLEKTIGRMGFRNFGVALGTVGGQAGRLSAALGVAGGAIDRFDAKHKGAATRVAGRIPQFAKGAAAVGAIGLAASGVAGKVGLQNAAMGASLGLIAGPWGAAVGGTAGLVMDIFSDKTAGASASLDTFNNSLRSGDLSTARIELDKYREQMDQVGNSIGKVDWKTIAKGVLTGDAVGAASEKIRGTSSAYSDMADKMGEAEKAYDQLKAKLTADVNINLDQSLLNFDELIKQFKADDIEIGVSLKGQAGIDLRRAISDIASSANEAFEITGDTAAIDTAIDKIKQFGTQAGLSGAEAQVMANIAVNGFTSVENAVKNLPPGTNLKVSADLKDFLAKYGIAGDKIGELEDAASKPLAFSIEGGSLDTITNKVGTIKEQLAGMPANTPINVTTNAGVVQTTVGELDSVIKNVPGVVPTNFVAHIGDLLTNAATVGQTVRNSPGKKTTVFDGNKGPFDRIAGVVRGIKIAKKVGTIEANSKPFNDAAKNIDRKKLNSKTVTINAVLNGAKGAVKALGKVLGFAKGGFVYGAGTGISDSIPALLSNGEFVVRAAQAKKFAPILESINENRPLPAPLPSASGVSSQASTRRSSSGNLRTVAGYVTLTSDSRALLHLTAEEVYDDSASHDQTIVGM